MLLRRVFCMTGKITMRKIQILLIPLLIGGLLAISGCVRKEKHQDTEYNFYDLAKFSEWYQGHIMAVGALVSDDPSSKSRMLIKPGVDCLQENFIDPSVRYELQINNKKIPLEVIHKNNAYRIVINTDSGDFTPRGELRIKKTDRLNIIFKINGKEEINYAVLVPPELTSDHKIGQNLDNPVELAWRSEKDSDTQILHCEADYYPGNGQIITHEYNYLARSVDRSFLLSMNRVLGRLTSSLADNPKAETMKISYLSLEATNYEEQFWHVIYATRRLEFVKGIPSVKAERIRTSTINENNPPGSQTIAQKKQPPELRLFEYEPYTIEPIPINPTPPVYPEYLKQSGIEGVVYLEVEVYSNGAVRNASVLQSLMAGKDGLDEAAIKLVKSWNFFPGKDKNGEPIDTKVIVPVEFTLPD
jgi:TonB family protein